MKPRLLLLAIAASAATALNGAADWRLLGTAATGDGCGGMVFCIAEGPDARGTWYASGDLLPGGARIEALDASGRTLRIREGSRTLVIPLASRTAARSSPGVSGRLQLRHPDTSTHGGDDDANDGHPSGQTHGETPAQGTPRPLAAAKRPAAPGTIATAPSGAAAAPEQATPDGPRVGRRPSTGRIPPPPGFSLDPDTWPRDYRRSVGLP